MVPLPSRNSLKRQARPSDLKGPLLFLLPALLLFATGFLHAAEAEKAPVSPNASCLECHSDTTLDLTRDGKKVSLFVDEKLFAASIHKDFSCVDCHEGFDGDALPHKAPITKVNCLSCHEKLGKSHAFHPRLGQEQIPQGADTNCSACHGTHGIVDRKSATAPFELSRQLESCGQCHQQAKATLEASAHGKWLNASAGRSPSCIACHKEAVVGKPGVPPTVELKLAQIKLCESCHADKEDVSSRTILGKKFVASYETSVHGAALHAGKAEAPGCVDCHGSHGTNPSMAADSKVNQQNVAATCARCHDKQATEYRASVHATTLAKGNLDSPSCTRCHGEHDIRAHGDPSSPIHAKNLSQQICATCHASLRLSKKYGFAPDRFSTFSDSYHGLSVRGGSAVVVNCASCHGAHEIKSDKDPDSSVNKTRLTQTCGQCHPGANTRFTVGSVHASPDEPDKEPLLYWVSTIYLILIIVVVGGMALHNLLDFIKKARRKLLIQKGVIVEHHVEHRLYLRMTAHERLQHATLVISFVLLVITGFMLRYPEAWWVLGIHHLSPNAFELRSLIHRLAGVVMLLGGVWHVGYLAFSPLGRKLFLDLLPRWNDLTDPFRVLRYNLGLSEDKPKFGRFCYIEKAEYWALVWGTLLMGATGAVLWFENASMGTLTKLGFDVARTIHFYEAILATLAIIVWHFYFVIFNPDIYPMNLSWLTGRMSEKEMLEEHPGQLEQIKASEVAALSAAPLPLKEEPSHELAPREDDDPPPPPPAHPRA